MLLLLLSAASCTFSAGRPGGTDSDTVAPEQSSEAPDGSDVQTGPVSADATSAATPTDTGSEPPTEGESSAAPDPVTEPAATEHAETSPEITTQAVTDPVDTTPEITYPPVTEPVDTTPEITSPQATEPVETTPAATEPAATTAAPEETTSPVTGLPVWTGGPIELPEVP